MNHHSIESSLISLSTAEDKLEFFFNNFSEKSLLSLFQKHLPPKSEVGDTWYECLNTLVSLLIHLHVRDRDEGLKTSVGFDAYQDFQSLLDKRDSNEKDPLAYRINLYIAELPESGAADKGHPRIHLKLMKMVKGTIEKVYKHLDAIGNRKEQVKAPKIGDVVSEGPGFEVIVGPTYRNTIRYYDEKMAVVLIHDPRDGHFLLVERYCPITGLFLLELPKVAPNHSDQKKTAAECVVKDVFGLPLRDLEVIGVVQPDSLIIKGVCEVYYGTYDLEENVVLQDKTIRSIKRVTEDGVYQAAFDGRLSCAVTLSAISIWRAFESVRKKRLANSNRVRKPVKDDEGDED